MGRDRQGRQTRKTGRERERHSCWCWCWCWQLVCMSLSRVLGSSQVCRQTRVSVSVRTCRDTANSLLQRMNLLARAQQQQHRTTTTTRTRRIRNNNKQARANNTSVSMTLNMSRNLMKKTNRATPTTPAALSTRGLWRAGARVDASQSASLHGTGSRSISSSSVMRNRNLPLLPNQAAAVVGGGLSFGVLLHHHHHHHHLLLLPRRL